MKQFWRSLFYQEFASRNRDIVVSRPRAWLRAINQLLR